MHTQLEDRCGHVRRIGRSPSFRQMRGPQYLPYVPGNRVGYQDADPSSAKGQTSQDPGHSRDVAGEESVLQERARVPRRPPAPRMQDRQARQVIPKAHDRAAVHSK